MNILTEATGSLTSNYIIKAIQSSGYKAVGSDISEFNHGKALCDDFIIMPRINDDKLWEKTFALLKKHKIDIVIPSFDETLLDWARYKEELEKENIHVILSPFETLEKFQDKWNTYEFFKSINIPTPKTSLTADFEIIKPRLGRGGSGIFENSFKNDFSMEGNISQEKIEGEEYTVDVFFTNDGKPLYIVPRKRVDVKDGKSTKGIVVKDLRIDEHIIEISKHTKFIGPINFQLFITKDNEIVFIEVNPRIAGGMALGFAATENWIDLIVNNIVKKEAINNKKSVNYGLRMVRYYEESFF